jgi:hypothetical protein
MPGVRACVMMRAWSTLKTDILMMAATVRAAEQLSHPKMTVQQQGAVW